MKFKLLPQIVAMTRYAMIGMVFQCFFVGLLAASDLSAQEKSIEDIYLSVNLRNVNLEDAFVQIVEKTNLNFQYTKEQVARKKLDYTFTNASLGSVLRTISKETGLGFRRVKETIYVMPNLSKKVTVTESVGAEGVSMIQVAARELKQGIQAPFRSESISKLLNNASRLQKLTVAGRVMGDGDNDPIPGVNILEKGTINGTNTDVEGNFSINVTNTASVLVFSAIGYVSQ
jgi:hypothetical protein